MIIYTILVRDDIIYVLSSLCRNLHDDSVSEVVVENAIASVNKDYYLATPTGFRPTHFRFASGASVIYPLV